MRQHIVTKAAAIIVMLVSTAPSESADPARTVRPKCIWSAPILNAYDPRVEGYIVKLVIGAGTKEQIYALAKKYGFKVEGPWEMLGSWYFGAKVSPEIIAALRCEKNVESIEYAMEVRAS